MFPYVFPEKPLVNKMCNWKRPPDLKRNNVKVEIMQKKLTKVSNSTDRFCCYEKLCELCFNKGPLIRGHLIRGHLLYNPITV